MIKYCECGCKKEMKLNQRFVRGHNNRGENNIAKNPETRIKISINRKGKCMGDNNPAKLPENRLKISQALTGHECSEERRKNISNSKKGIKNPKHSIILKEKYKNGYINPNTKEKVKFGCINCSKILYIRPGALKRRKFCSKKCSNSGKFNCMFNVHRFNEKNPNWIDGRSHFPYPLEFKLIRKNILERDNYTCQLCGDKIEKNTKRKFISVHHIDYNKNNNSEDNLITLCNFCNSSVNKDRIDWTKYFKNKIENIIN